MKIYVIGADGNMGSRYRAILKYLEHEAWGIDLPYIYGESLTRTEAQASDGVIVTTPTESHLDILEMLEGVSVPILCEKPFINRESQMKRLESYLENTKSNISMVSQYDYLVYPEQRLGLTKYDYFKSGKDTLPWDCINIIYHATGKIELKNESPVWRCVVNGIALNLSMMDYAYIEMIEKWIANPGESNKDRIFRSHQKVVEYLHGKHQ